MKERIKIEEVRQRLSEMLSNAGSEETAKQVKDGAISDMEVINLADSCGLLAKMFPNAKPSDLTKMKDGTLKAVVRVYISGAISSVGYEQAKRNFDEAKEKIKKLGANYLPVSPMDFDSEEDFTQGEQDEETRKAIWKKCMKRDIKLLMECDMIYLMDNYAQSDGALLEKYIAEEVGITRLIMN